LWVGDNFGSRVGDPCECKDEAEVCASLCLSSFDELESFSSGRARQLESMFDVPRRRDSLGEWHGDLPIEKFDWHIGLIVGPSGSRKSSIPENNFVKRRSFAGAPRR